jgi:hypothetical protein
MASFSVGTDELTVAGTIGDTPPGYERMIERALLHDDFGSSGEGTLLVVTVERASEHWPPLVVTQRFYPGPEAGFQPGAFLVSEENVLFVGAGTRIVAYDVLAPRRLWVDEANTGFWCWKRHGDVVIMSAELEMAAWDTHARKLWTTFVEPPWDYRVVEGLVHLDVMGTKSMFPVATGPQREAAG